MLNKIRVLNLYWIFIISHYFNYKNVIHVFFVLNCRWGKKKNRSTIPSSYSAPPDYQTLWLFSLHIWMLSVSTKASGLLISAARWSLITCSGSEGELRFWSPKCWSTLYPCLITWILTHSWSCNPVAQPSWAGPCPFPACFPGDDHSASWPPWSQLPVRQIPKQCPLDSLLLLLLVCAGPSIHAPN